MKTPKEIADNFRKKPAGIMMPMAANLIEEGICPICRDEIGDFKDDKSRKEYEISGMCQNCQDKIFR